MARDPEKLMDFLDYIDAIIRAARGSPGQPARSTTGSFARWWQVTSTDRGRGSTQGSITSVLHQGT